MELPDTAQVNATTRRDMAVNSEYSGDANNVLTLSLMSSTGKSGAQGFKLTDSRNVIGRRNHNAIVLTDNTVSGEHAAVSLENAGYFIEDLNSSNGTVVNGNAITRTELKDGDIIEVGIYRLKVRLANREDDSPDATPCGVLEYVSGSMRGVKQRLEKPLIKLSDESDTAVISRRRSGFFLSRLDGGGVPVVNKRSVGARAICLRDGDEIELGSCRIRFRLL